MSLRDGQQPGLQAQLECAALNVQQKNLLREDGVCCVSYSTKEGKTLEGVRRERLPHDFGTKSNVLYLL